MTDTMNHSFDDSTSRHLLELNELQLQISQLQLANSELTTKLDQRQAVIDHLKRERKTLEEELATYKSNGVVPHSSNHSHQHESTSQNEKQLLEQISSLQQQLHQTQQMLAMSQATPMFVKDDRIERELQTLSRANEELASKNKELASQIGLRERELNGHRERSSNSQQARIQELEARLASDQKAHESELIRVQQQLAALSLELQHQQRQQQKSPPRLSASQSQASQGSLLALSRREEELKKKVDDKLAELNRLEAQINERREVLLASTSPINTTEAPGISDQSVAAESQLKQYDLLLNQAQSSLQSTQNELLLAKHAVSDLEAEQQRIKAAIQAEQIAVKEALKADQAAAREAIRLENERNQEELNKRKQLESEIRNMEQTYKSALTLEREELKSEVMAEHVRLNELRQEREKLQHERDTLQQHLERMFYANKELEAKSAHLKQENQTILERIASTAAQTTEQVRIENEIKNSVDLLASISAEINLLREQQAQLDAQHTKTKEIGASVMLQLETQIKLRQTELDQLETAIANRQQSTSSSAVNSPNEPPTSSNSTAAGPVHPSTKSPSQPPTPASRRATNNPALIGAFAAPTVSSQQHARVPTRLGHETTGSASGSTATSPTNKRSQSAPRRALTIDSPSNASVAASALIDQEASEAEQNSFEVSRAHYARELAKLQKQIAGAQIKKRAMKDEVDRFAKECTQAKVELLEKLDLEKKELIASRATDKRVEKYLQEHTLGPFDSSKAASDTPAIEPPSQAPPPSTAQYADHRGYSSGNTPISPRSPRFTSQPPPEVKEDTAATEAMEELQKKLNALEHSHGNHRNIKQQTQSLINELKQKEEIRETLTQQIKDLQAQWAELTERVASVTAPLIASPTTTQQRMSHNGVNGIPSPHSKSSTNANGLAADDSTPTSPLDVALLKQRNRDLTRMNTELLTQLQSHSSISAFDGPADYMTLLQSSPSFNRTTPPSTATTSPSDLLPYSAFLSLQDIYHHKEVSFQTQINLLRQELHKVDDEHKVLLVSLTQHDQTGFERRIALVEEQVTNWVKKLEESHDQSAPFVSSSELYHDLLALLASIQTNTKHLSGVLMNFAQQLGQLRTLRLQQLASTDQAVAERDGYILFLIDILKSRATPPNKLLKFLPGWSEEKQELNSPPSKPARLALMPPTPITTQPAASPTTSAIASIAASPPITTQIEKPFEFEFKSASPPPLTQPTISPAASRAFLEKLTPFKLPMTTTKPTTPSSITNPTRIQNLAHIDAMANAMKESLQRGLSGAKLGRIQPSSIQPPFHSARLNFDQ